MGRFDGKTEKATPQRRRKARREGTVARSPEVAVAVVLAAGLATVRAVGPQTIELAARETRFLLSLPLVDGELPVEPLVAAAARMLVGAAAPFLVVAFVAALAAGVAQVGFRLATQAARPKLKNISPRKGLERFKPANAGWELLRTAVKMGLVVAVSYGPISAWSQGRGGGDPSLSGALTRTLTTGSTLLVRLVLVAVVIAAADYAWNRHKTTRELRMTKQEVRREHKDSEGDPLLRGERKRRAMQLSRNRMLRDVTTADVLVTNPTFLVVALRYEAGDAAPRVVAKGAGVLAARLRSLAYRHGIPVTPNKPLARALYRRCKVGHFVPAALYEAVAVVLAVAYRRTGRVPGSTVRSAA